MKLHWVRLSNGYHYCPELHVQVGKASPSGWVTVRTPNERDTNYDDGWRWSEVVDSKRQVNAHFGNLPDAKKWVEDNRDLVDEQNNWDYDGQPKLPPIKLTQTQKDMLHSVKQYQHTYAYLRGLAQHGGAARSRSILEYQDLIGRDGANTVLTLKGEEALASGVIENPKLPGQYKF